MTNAPWLFSVVSYHAGATTGVNVSQPFHRDVCSLQTLIQRTGFDRTVGTAREIRKVARAALPGRRGGFALCVGGHLVSDSAEMYMFAGERPLHPSRWG